MISIIVQQSEPDKSQSFDFRLNTKLGFVKRFLVLREIRKLPGVLKAERIDAYTVRIWYKDVTNPYKVEQALKPVVVSTLALDEDEVFFQSP